jgi:hypothetical protein
VRRAARATGIASSSTSNEGKGGFIAALFPNTRSLLVEAVVIAALLVLAGFLVYHFTTHTIRNTRPLGAVNVDASPVSFDQTQASFAVDPSDPRRVFGASSDSGAETLDVFDSTNGGTSWKHAAGPSVPGGSCAHGEPSVAASGGREYLAFLAASFCGDALTPYLVFTSRTPGGTWERLVRVSQKSWKFGFDDAPNLAARGSTLYLVWTRGIDKPTATTVLSTSRDAGRTWSAPKPVSAALDHPHHPTVAVAANGDVYVAGIDAKTGLWVVRSRDGGRTFTPPQAAAQLRNNPAGSCALTAGDPLPNELRTCAGPDPTLLVGTDRVFVVYSDVAANKTPDVYVAALDRDLKPLFDTQVNPAEKKATQQFVPAAGLDSSTGTLWACWYDTTFDPNAHRVWFTCAASHDGRKWSSPVRAASEPTPTDVVFGAVGQRGIVPSVAAAHGVAHVAWSDGRIIENSMDVFTAAIPERTAFAAKP